MRRILFLLLFLSVAFLLHAQEPIRFGEREIYLEANVSPTLRGKKTSSLELGLPTGNHLNVLVQFESQKRDYEALRRKGVVLADYLGANAYYASVAPGSRPSDFVGTGLRTVVPIRGEWKVVSGIIQGTAPDWAIEGKNLKVNLSWFKGVTAEQVKADLQKRGIALVSYSDHLSNAEITATREQILALTEANYVAFVRWTEPPQELTNYYGARLSGASVLRILPREGGRGLTGYGVRIGIWDGNVGDHVDYGNRVHRCEFEQSVSTTGAHGMHTTGTIVGSGLLDPKARGIAPEAEIWTYNYGISSNGKPVAQEMFETYQAENISLTSNSYGLKISKLCAYDEFFNYTMMGNQNVDYLSYNIPTLTHVYAAGNDQTTCKRPFSHSGNYSKNIISVGALDAFGTITHFSSFGPLLDGRIYPIVSAYGYAVSSTVAEQKYAPMNGTSMACPNVTGHLALLTQRWKQLHGGALPVNYFLKALIANTADDAGNRGPDYKYGFGILNAEAAVSVIESESYELAQLTTDKLQNDLTVQVPAGVKELRVMLCWNDPVVRKEYVTGESPLVNDLDLSVALGSTTHLPLTLDHKSPDTEAVEAVNKVDNIEQVVIRTPTAGAYTIKVNGVLKQGDVQPYAIVWYFDYQRPAIVSPAANDVYEAGEAVYLRTRNMPQPLTVALSTDNGATYSILGRYDANAAIMLPKTLSPSREVKFRLTDAEGSISETETFTVMERVKDLKLEASACTTEGWKLTWTAVKDAARYEILKGDIVGGQYVKIADVAASSTEYIVPNTAIDLGRNVYAVRALSNDGVVGMRSVGVLSHATMPLKLSAEKLPLFESFVGSPFQHATIESGKNLKFTVQEALAWYALPFDSHMLVWQPNKKATSWDEPFTNHRENVGAVSTCEIDLTAIAANTPLHFVVNYYMAKNDNPEGSLLRLLVNGEEVADVLGRAHITGDSDEHFVTWDFSPYAGQKISIKLEFAFETPKDGIVLISYKLMTQTEKPDVGIVWANTPEIKAKAKMTSEDIRFKVQNFASSDARNVPVSVQVDGKVVYAYLIETLKPFEDRIFTYKHNFESSEAHKYTVDICTSLDGDTRKQNDAASFEVYNMGDVLTMPEITYEEFMGSLFPQIPYDMGKVNGRTKFVDGRGELEPYNAGEFAVFKLLPTLPDRVLQATFSQHAFAPTDTLYVFTNTVPANLQEISTKQASYVLTGRATEPRTFISEAKDGAITFVFIGNNKQASEGWVAELSELPMPNQWQLLDVNEVEGADAQHSKLALSVKNLLPVSCYNVGVYLSVNGVTKRMEITELPTGTSTVALEEQLEVAPPMCAEVLVTLAKDGDVSDNSKEIVIQHDPIGGTAGIIAAPAELYVSKVTPLGERDTVNIEPSKRILYKTEREIPLYSKSLNALTLVLSAKPTQEQSTAKIRIWTNIDGDNELRDTPPELVVLPVERDKRTYEALIDLSTVSSVVMGKQRLRIMLATDDGYAQFKEGKEMPWGSVVDLTASIRDGVSPNDYELALLQIESPKTAHELSATESVSLKVRNNGLARQTSVMLTCTIDNTTFDETVSCDIAPRGGEATLTLQRTADLSLEGKHSISIALKNKDGYEADNELKLTLFNIAKRTDDLYALSFVGDKDEYVIYPRIGQNVTDKATLEGWWYLNKPQFSGLIYGGEQGIQLLSMADNDVYADNTLALLIGPVGGYVSTQPVIKPGQWQHIAITLQQDEDMFTGKMLTTAEAFVDGQKIKLKRVRYDGFQFSHLWANVRMQGRNAMFRLWNSIRTPAQIKDDMYSSVRTTEGRLPEGCEAEFLYTEGRGIASASGDEHFATFHSTRTDDIWKKLDGVVRSVQVAKQVRETQLTDNEMTVTMPQDFVGFDKVKLQFLLEWSDAVVTHNGATVTQETEIDFTQNTEHKLAFKAEKSNLFGKTLTQEFTVRLVNDLSNACSIEEIALQKEKNAGLKNDISVNNPNEMVVFEAEDESPSDKFDAKKANLSVLRLSAGAKLYYGTEEVTVGAAGAIVQLDLSSPQVLRVVAQNGYDTKNYMVRLAMPQEISWQEEEIERTFGKEVLMLDATASSGLGVSYISLDPSIVTVDAKGQLITAGIGSTALVAYQDGNGQYKPAPKKIREVSVTRSNLTIKVKDIAIGQGEQLPPLDFEYAGLQFEGTERDFAWPYEIQKTDGSVYDEAQQLTPGVYRIVPQKYSGTYEFGNYNVTRETGTLTILDPQRAKAITFIAKDQGGAPLADVALQCNGYSYMTQADGKCVLYLLPRKKEYTVEATKQGYQTAEKAFVVTEATEIPLQLSKLVYNISYTADANGIISGNSQQMVAAQQDGEQVIAVSRNLQHRFKRWSDGVETAARTDRGVMQNISVTAEFEPYFYTLRYTVTEGGEFVSSEATQVQEVAPGADGETVTVKEKAGYIFLGWEDGDKNLTRTDRNIWGDKTLNAVFFKPYLLAWTENFDNEATTLQGWEYGASKYGRGWKLYAEKTISATPDAKGYALAIAPLFEPAPKPIYNDCWVATPWLDLQGGDATSRIVLTYKSRMKVIGATKARVEYCFEDGVWIQAHNVAAAIQPTEASFEWQASDFLTHKYLRIRWVFTTPSSSTYLAIDDIKVAFAASDRQVLRYYAAENGMLQKEGDDNKVAYIELQTPKNTFAREVRAIPNTGYVFERWSDGIETPERKDALDVTVVAIFQPKVKPTFTTIYKVSEHGEALIGSTYQVRTEGEFTSPVTAIAKTGYHFSQWSDGRKENPRVDEVTSDATYTAEFESDSPTTYAVTLTKEGEGSLSITGIEADKLGAVPEGTELVAVATPRTEWKLKSLMAGDKDIKTDGKFTVAADVEVKAIFEKETPVTDAQFAKVQVVPNPFALQLKIKNEEAVNARYELINTNGVVVRSGALQDVETVLNTEDLAAGVYLLRILAGSETKTLRVVKE